MAKTKGKHQVDSKIVQFLDQRKSTRHRRVTFVIEQFEDNTYRITSEGFGSARVLKLHLAHEPDIILQPSPIEEPGKVY